MQCDIAKKYYNCCLYTNICHQKFKFCISVAILINIRYVFRILIYLISLHYSLLSVRSTYFKWTLRVRYYYLCVVYIFRFIFNLPMFLCNFTWILFFSSQQSPGPSTGLGISHRSSHKIPKVFEFRAEMSWNNKSTSKW